MKLDGSSARKNLRRTDFIFPRKNIKQESSF